MNGYAMRVHRVLRTADWRTRDLAVADVQRMLEIIDEVEHSDLDSYRADVLLEELYGIQARIVIADAALKP